MGGWGEDRGFDVRSTVTRTEREDQVVFPCFSSFSSVGVGSQKKRPWGQSPEPVLPDCSPRERTASPFCLFLGLSIDTALLPSVPGTPLKATLIPSRTLVQSFCPQLRFSSVTRLLPSLAFAQLSKVPTPSLLHKLCVPPLTLIYGNLSHWGPWWKPCCLIKWMFSGPFILEFSIIFNASIIFSWKFSSLAPVEITY